MSFTIALYNNKSERNKLDKTLTSIASYTGVLKNEADIVKPVVIVQAATVKANYAYISELGRYYFIDKIVSENNNIWRLEMSCDVLSTYKTAIRAQTAILRRQKTLYNRYLDDEKFKCLSNERVQTKTFPQGFSNNAYYYLVLAGG